MSKVLRVYPFIFNYKSLHISITESDDDINVELNSVHMIHTSYMPNTPKGNKMVAKINLPNTERLGTKTNGVSMHLTLNPELGWFYTITESETSIEVEFHTNSHHFMFEQTINANKAYSLKACLSLK